MSSQQKFVHDLISNSLSSFQGRVTMTMTTLLTLTAMFGAVRSNVPRVSYVSLLDIWMFMCIVFVFIVIIHFIIVISLLRHGHKRIASALETLGAMIIPLLFLVFNMAYWPTMFEGSYVLGDKDPDLDTIK